MRSIAAFFNALVLASTVAVLCVRSITICMKVNVGVLFLGALALFFVLFRFALRKTDPRKVLKLSLIVLAICAVLVVALYTFVFPQALIAQPGWVFRQAFHLGFSPVVPAAVALLGVLACSFAAEVVWAFRAHDREAG